MLLAALGSVRIGKNCDLGLENVALGLRPRAAFSRPRSQFFPIRTSQPVNNIYVRIEITWKFKLVFRKVITYRNTRWLEGSATCEFLFDA